MTVSHLKQEAHQVMLIKVVVKGNKCTGNAAFHSQRWYQRAPLQWQVKRGLPALLPSALAL